MAFCLPFFRGVIFFGGFGFVIRSSTVSVALIFEEEA